MDTCTWDPRHLNPLMQKAVADWLADHGQRRYVALRPVRRLGPIAFYWAIVEVPPRSERVLQRIWPDRIPVLLVPAVRWVGSSWPSLGAPD